MLPPNDTQAVFLAEDARAPWRRNRIGLWFYAGVGCVRIILSGVSLVFRR
jgi:hypothetical protein